MTRTTILDYGVGNLHSLAKALAAAGGDVRVEADAARAMRTDLLVLPGVGAFSPAAGHLASHRAQLRAAIQDGLPVLGICLGMQLLFDGSDEGPGDGLGIVRGRVTRLTTARTPRIGWSTLEDSADGLLAASGLRDVYYANSFAARPAEPGCVRAWSTHGTDRFPAMIRVGHCVGVQFHPEKSSRAGIAFLSSVVRAALPA